MDSELPPLTPVKSLPVRAQSDSITSARFPAQACGPDASKLVCPVIHTFGQPAIHLVRKPSLSQLVQGKSPVRNDLPKSGKTQPGCPSLLSRTEFRVQTYLSGEPTWGSCPGTQQSFQASAEDINPLNTFSGHPFCSIPMTQSEAKFCMECGISLGSPNEIQKPGMI